MKKSSQNIVSENELREIIGERVTTSLFERMCYTADFVPIPKMVKMLFKTLPDAVVKPVEAQQVAQVLHYCAAKGIPVTPRGGGSSGLFGAVPKNGGLLLDLRELSRVRHVDPEAETVTAEAGITWWELDRVLRGKRLTLRSYPSSARSATLGGWIMGSGLGIGSLKYKAIFDQVAAAEVALPDGAMTEYMRGQGLEWFFESEGMLGVLVSVTLNVRRLPEEESHHLVAFAHIENLFEFVAELSGSSPTPYAIEVFDDRYMGLVEASGYHVTPFSPGGGSILVTYEGTQHEVRAGGAIIERLVPAHKGEMRGGAEEEWQHRFNMMRIRRAVPTVLPSSVHVPVRKLDEFYRGLNMLDKRPLGFLGHLVSDNDCMVMPLLVTDQRRPVEYLCALHTPRAIAELALSVGGVPGGGIGVWNAPYKKRILSPQRIDEIRQKKADLDPKGILNPGMWLDPSFLFSPLVYHPAMVLAGLADRILPTSIGQENRNDPTYEFSACVQCGYCMNYCPTKGTWVSSTPRGRILMTKDVFKDAGLEGSKLSPDYVESIFQCSLCGRCKIDCTVAIGSPEMWVELRSALAREGVEPESLKNLSKVIAETHNLSAKVNEQRAGWAKKVKVRPDLNRKTGADIVYFVGCVTSFYPMVQDVARSFVQLLDLAECDFTLLGGEEWCCGYPLVSAGHKEEALGTLLHNVETVKGMGVKTLVVTCPGCLRMWRHGYKTSTGLDLPFEVLHSTELILRLMKEKKIELSELPWHLTYHDPCDLGRVSGLFDPPRDIIRSLPAVTFTELEDNRQYCTCCGSGGDLLASNTDMSLAIAARKLEQALRTGAKTLVTACPSCIRSLTMARLASKAQIEVLDIVQLTWKAASKNR